MGPRPIIVAVRMKPYSLGRMESEMVTVKYDDLSTAFDFVSFAGPMEHRAYVSLDTGAIYWISDLTLRAGAVDAEKGS